MAKLLTRAHDPKVPEETLRYLEHFRGEHIFMTLNPVRHYNCRITEAWVNLEKFDAFFCVNEMPNGKRDKLSDITCRAIWVEDDTDRDRPREDFPLAPSIIVKSSNKHWHYYWLTDTKNKDEWNDVMARMVFSHGCDPGARDISRVLRLPGTYNNKQKYEVPQLCSLVESNGKVYPWSMILSAFPALKQVPADPITAISNNKKFNVIGLMNDFMEARSIWPSMCSLMQHWRFHYSEEKTRDLVESMFAQVSEELSATHATRYKYALTEVDRQLKNATKKVQKYRAADCTLRDNIVYRDIQSLTGTLIKSTEIPRTVLPECLWEAACACGEYLSLGPDPAILTGISTVSSLLNKNVLIKHIKDSPYENYCTMGMIVVMETGTRKTEIYKVMNKPLRDYEILLQQSWETEKNYNRTMAEMLTIDLKKIAKSYDKIKDAGPKEREQVVLKMTALQDELEKLQVVRPTLYTKDITEEEIIRKLYDNKGVLSIVSDDSRNIIKNIMGRYNKNSTSEGIYIDGLTGSPEIPVKYNRAKDGGTEYVINGPALNVFLFVQQDVALTLKQSTMYQASGLAARLLMYFYPVDPIKMVRNSDRSRQIDQEKIKEYYERVQKLCIRRQDDPLVVTVSDRAQDRFNQFNQTYADMLGKDFSTHQILNKMITQSVIYSVCMAAIDDDNFVEQLQHGETYELTAMYANQGIGLMHIVAEQLVNTYQILDDIEIALTSQKFIKTLTQKYASGNYTDGFIRRSTLYNAFSYLNKDNYIQVVDYLVEKGWLGTTVAEGNVMLNQGRTPSAKAGDTIYHLNTKAIATMEILSQED